MVFTLYGENAGELAPLSLPDGGDDGLSGMRVFEVGVAASPLTIQPPFCGFMHTFDDAKPAAAGKFPHTWIVYALLRFDLMLLE